jgi:membrane protein
MIREAKAFLAETAGEFGRDRCFHLAAALSYYTLFSLAPMLVVVIAAAGIFFGREAVSGEIYGQLRALIGPEGAMAVQKMIQGAAKPDLSRWAGLLGAITLFVGATTVFIQLQDALNVVWGVKPRARGGQAMWKMLRDRVLSFGMILGVGFLLVVSLAANTLLAATSDYISARYPAIPVAVFQTLETVCSFAVITVLFAMLFKFLPDARVRWRDVWIGAAVTAVLFAAGKELIGFYLGRSDLTSTYGAAAAVVILILWVNYSSLILFAGAEFTQVYARRYGQEILPAVYATAVDKHPEAAAPRVQQPEKPPRDAFVDALRGTVALAIVAFVSGRVSGRR